MRGRMAPSPPMAECERLLAATRGCLHALAVRGQELECASAAELAEAAGLARELCWAVSRAPLPKAWHYFEAAHGFALRVSLAAIMRPDSQELFSALVEAQDLMRDTLVSRRLAELGGLQ